MARLKPTPAARGVRVNHVSWCVGWWWVSSMLTSSAWSFGVQGVQQLHQAVLRRKKYTFFFSCEIFYPYMPVIVDSPGLNAAVHAPVKHHPGAARGSPALLNIKRFPKCCEALMAEQLHHVLAAHSSSKEIKGMMSSAFLI